MTDAKASFDVAISFCHEDFGVAAAIRDGIGDALEVFVYSERQEEVAGTDGLESFRDIFRNRCRLAVILFRAPWGTTPWTRVELEAITDRFLHEGPGFLFVLCLDDSAPPPWIPDKLIRLSLKAFTVEQAIGAIKARALEQGGSLKVPSAQQLALRAQDAMAFGKRRERLFRSQEGVVEAADEADRLLKLLHGRVLESQRAAPDLGIVCGADASAVGVRVPGVTFYVGYSNRVINSLSEAKLFVRELRGGATVPGEFGYFFESPLELSLSHCTPDLVLGQGWCWREADGRVLTTEALVERLLAQFFRLVHRLAAGELPEPS